jgi:hypothetical protein
LKFYYKERTAKNQCKVLSEEKGMLTIQMRNGGRFLVSKKSVLKEAVNLPRSSDGLAKEDVIKMLYLVAGWVENNKDLKASFPNKISQWSRSIESMALDIHDL